MHPVTSSKRGITASAGTIRGVEAHEVMAVLVPVRLPATLGDRPPSNSFAPPASAVDAAATGEGKRKPAAARPVTGTG